MKKNKKKEELQSRREFFKSAAKAALPVIGAVILSNVPSQLFAAGPHYGSKNCGTTCAGGCVGSCTEVCNSSCKGTCNNTCYSGCYRGCKNVSD